VDTTLKGLLRLLDGADVEARCAALLVLTRLAVDADRVVRAVGRLLGGKNVVVRDFAVGYFEGVRPKEGIGHLLPLLDVEDDALRQRVVAVLAHYGNAAIAPAKRLLAEPPRRRLNAIIDLCGRVRSAPALDILFELMSSEDLDTNRAACDAVVATVATLDERARGDLFARAERLIAGAKGQRTPLVAAAKLLGALGQARARKRLFPLLAAREPQVVRTHAIGALVQCLRGQPLTQAEVETLLPLLDEPDENGILRPAIRLLEDQTLDRRYLSTLNRLAESPQPVVKRFAVQKLGGFESGAVVKTLIGYLTDDSYARRDQATASLKALPAARLALMKELLACDDERKAWTIADILLLHDRSWKRDVLGELWNKLQGAVETREDRLYTPYVHFLNALDSEDLATRVRARADHQRKAKRFADSAKWLLLLKDSPAFDAEAKFALAVAELKSHPRRPGAPARRHDLALDLLRALADSPFPLAERLRRERVLTADELYYAGFNLAEGRGEQLAVARELLAHVADKHGRTKTGKAAKNKLKLLPAAASA
jgi:hypothetical protein